MEVSLFLPPFSLSKINYLKSSGDLTLNNIRNFKNLASSKYRHQNYN